MVAKGCISPAKIPVDILFLVEVHVAVFCYLCVSSFAAVFHDLWFCFH